MDTSETLMSPNTYLFIQKEGPSEFQCVFFPPSPFSEFSHDLTFAVISALEENKIDPPETAIREVVDNLVHAIPCNTSVVVYPSMGFVSMCDTGRGIPDLDLALQPGFTTADSLSRRYVRGAGLGLFLASRDLEEKGGKLYITSRPGLGTYIRLELKPEISRTLHTGSIETAPSIRQMGIITLLAESGPQNVRDLAEKLGVSISTAYRDVRELVRESLLVRDPSGKLFLSQRGRRYLQSLSGL